MDLVYAWLHAFIATLVLETPIVVWLTRDSGLSIGRRIAISVFANLATHPAVWFIIPHFGLSSNGTLLVAEVWAIAIEWAIYFVAIPKITVQRALAVSAIANGASYAIGLVLYTYTSVLG